ncbi:MAG TPA: hypothetical protein VK518_15260, partial [Puia sp.]|nr:hypothetical protein [Puia sp.]
LAALGHSDMTGTARLLQSHFVKKIRWLIIIDEKNTVELWVHVLTGILLYLGKRNFKIVLYDPGEIVRQSA